MNRLVLIAVVFTFLIASEVVITALAAETFDVCMKDTAGDGETETDSEEKSEDNNKIEILVLNVSEKDQTFSKALTHPKKSIFSKPYLDQATPPPEV